MPAVSFYRCRGILREALAKMQAGGSPLHQTGLWLLSLGKGSFDTHAVPGYYGGPEIKQNS